MTGEEQIVFHIGQDWRLPALMTLAVTFTNDRLLAYRDFYLTGLGPQLISLLLSDQSTRYHCQNLHTCPPPSQTLSKLTDIGLQGWPALTFDPKTLYQTPNLINLKVSMHRELNGISFIPTQEELEDSIFYVQEDDDTVDPVTMEATWEDSTKILAESMILHPLRRPPRQQKPLWSWDWYLPHLEKLCLDSVFAFLFEFRMLATCPSLKHLELNMTVEDVEHHKRVLSLQDFYKPNGSFDYYYNNSSTSDSSKLIVASSLQTLYLCGPWVLGDGLRSILFKTTFPNLVQLTEYYTFVYSEWQGWILPLLRKDMPHLKEASRIINYSTQESVNMAEQTMRDHGMALKPRQTFTPAFGSVVEDDLAAQKAKEHSGVLYRLNGVVWSFVEDLEG